MDLFGFSLDLRLENLALALAGHVLAGAHAENTCQRGCQPGNQDRERLTGCATYRADDGEGADEPILRSEHRFANFAQHTRRATLVGEVRLEPLRIVVRDCQLPFGIARDTHTFQSGFLLADAAVA